MKVNLVTYNMVHLELSHHDFAQLTGIKIGRGYGYVLPEDIIGKEYDLKKPLESIYNIRQVVELREKIVDYLETSIRRVKESSFPAVLPDMMAEEIKK